MFCLLQKKKKIPKENMVPISYDQSVSWEVNSQAGFEVQDL